MGRTLGIIWIVFAILGGVGSGYSEVAGMGADAVASVASFATTSLWNILTAIAIGLTYWLMSKASASAVPIIFGWIHLIFYALGSGVYAYANLLRNSAIRGETEFATVGIAYSASAGLQIIGSLIFIIALIVALASERHRPSSADF